MEPGQTGHLLWNSRRWASYERVSVSAGLAQMSRDNSETHDLDELPSDFEALKLLARLIN